MPFDVAAARTAALQLVEKANTNKSNDLVYHSGANGAVAKTYASISPEEISGLVADIEKLPVEDQKLVLAELEKLSTAKPDGTVYFMPYSAQYLVRLAEQLGVQTGVKAGLPAPPENGDASGARSPEMDALIFDRTSDEELDSRELTHLLRIAELDGEVTEKDAESLYHLIDRGGVKYAGTLDSNKYFSIPADAVSKLYRFFAKHGLPQANEAVFIKPRIDEPEFRRGGEANINPDGTLETYRDLFYLPTEKPAGAGYEARAVADPRSRTVTIHVSTPWIDGSDRFIHDPTESVVIDRSLEGEAGAIAVPFLPPNEDWTVKVLYEKAPNQWAEMFPPKQFNTGDWPVVSFG
jgi:hypothetical protein